MARSIVYDEDIFNEVCKRLDRLGEKTQECSQKMNSNFSSYTSRGMLSETVKNLGDNFTSTENAFSDTKNSTQRGFEMFKDERNGASEIEGIIVPQDFVGNNAIEINYYNASILSKIDGRSVNDGKGAKESEYDDSTVIAAENIFDMNKNKDTDEKKYDDTSVVGKSILGSINNGDQTDQRVYDDSTTVGNINLRNINESQTKERAYNDAVSINNIGLTNINGGVTSQQNFDNSTVIGKSILGSIDSGKEAEPQRGIDDFLAAYEENRKRISELNNEPYDDESQKDAGLYGNEIKKDE